MKLLMKADKDGGIPVLARLLERVVLAKDICLEKNITWLKQACCSKHNFALDSPGYSRWEPLRNFPVS